MEYPGNNRILIRTPTAGLQRNWIFFTIPNWSKILIKNPNHGTSALISHCAKPFIVAAKKKITSDPRNRATSSNKSQTLSRVTRANNQTHVPPPVDTARSSRFSPVWKIQYTYTQNRGGQKRSRRADVPSAYPATAWSSDVRSSAAEQSRRARAPDWSSGPRAVYGSVIVKARSTRGN